MKYRIYIDEVGNPDLESSDNPNHRFLSLTGVIIALDHVDKVIYPEMEALKKKYFLSHPDDPVIFHRKEMVNARGAFESLKDAEIKRLFDDELTSALADWDYVVVSVCIDKKAHREQYAAWRYDPYHYCLAVLLERYVFFLNRHDSDGDVMAESRGGKEDRRLKNSFARLWEKGTYYVEPAQFQRRLTSKQLKVRQKANNVSGLQLADLLAHPSRNEILAENGLRAEPLPPFAQRVIEILQDKYYQRSGKIHGKKLL